MNPAPAHPACERLPDPRRRRLLVTLATVVTILATLIPSAPAQAAGSSPRGPESLASTAVDAHPGYQYQRSCSPSAKPGTSALLSLLIKTWGGSSLGISRSCGVGTTSEHKEERALDWKRDVRKASHRKAVGKAITWMTANNGEVARRLGVMYIIWNQKIWSTYYPELGWRKMASRGSRTANHKDHVHISLTWDGAMKQTSWWTGVPVTNPLTKACTGSACLPTVARSSLAWSSVTQAPSPFLPSPGVVPAIGGSPAVGRTLVAVAGTWVPAGATVSYQWYSGTTRRIGATQATYQIGAQDRGRAIKVAVTATSADGSAVTKRSDVTTGVLTGKIWSAPTSIGGDPVVGATLSAVVDQWQPGGVLGFSYRWLRNGKSIKGATGSSYTPVAADLGKKIQR